MRSSIPTTIEIRQNIAPKCGAVMGDPTRIHQVIMNLCTNAYHAMRDTGGKLEVNLAEVDIEPGPHLTRLFQRAMSVFCWSMMKSSLLRRSNKC